MPNSYAQRAMQQRTHIPQHVEAAMNQHMERSMPAHLRKYVSADKPAYVPQAAQRQIEAAMQKSMPAHLKQYAGAYMEQRIAMPNTARPEVSRSATNFQPAPMPDKMRLDHSRPASQYSVDQEALPTNPANLFQADAAAQPALQQPGQTIGPGQAPAGPSQQPYDFIMNPGQPPKRGRLPGGNGSPLGRTLLISGGIIALMIVFVILKNLFAGGGNLDAYVGIVEDQQELIHLVGLASQQQDLSDGNGSFVATAQLSLNTSQQQMLQYLAKNHKKVSTKQLGLKVSKTTDDQLAAAETAGTYNQTFQDVMAAKLTAYSNDLKQTYQTQHGKIGRALLTDDFNQAQLLQIQLQSASTGTN